MNANIKKWEPYIYSGIGVVAVFLALVALGAITSTVRARVDFTEDRVFTLSEGTKKILGKIDTPVVINFYCTRGENQMPVALKNYAQRVEDLLAEYRQASRGKIEIRKFDPQPDSDAEDSARLDGIEGQNFSDGSVINLGEKVYLGLAISCLDQKVAIPFLDPTRERLLEYDLTRAIARVINPTKPTLGVMSGLPVFGQSNPMLIRMTGGQQDPWVLISELKNDFDVKQIDLSAETIDDSVNVLLVIHPANISEKTQFALDQFVLRGGHLIALLDPMSIVATRNSVNMQDMMQRAASGGSTLDKLLKAWGIEFDVSKVIADKNYVTQVRRGDRGIVAPEPTWLSLTRDAIDGSDVTTSEIDSLLLVGAGVFTGTPTSGINQTVLLKSSPNSQLVDKMLAQFGADTTKDFTPSGKEYALAVRLTGKFKTAFPDGKPDGNSQADKKDDEKNKKTDETEKEKPNWLKESTADGVVVLIGDSDFAYDQFSVSIQNFFGHKLIAPFNGNLNFVQNVVEQLTGDSNLISVRSRSVKNRPFTLVRKIQAHAEEQYRAKIKQLEQDLVDAQQKINELQRNADKSQRAILPKEVQDEIRRFRQKEAATNRELKEVRKQLRRDIDALETRLKWINIAGMPAMVTIAGVALAIVKRKQTAAK